MDGFLCVEPTLDVHIKSTNMKGKGVFATQFIPKGTLIGNYNGQLLSPENVTSLSLYAMHHVHDIIEPCNDKGELLEPDNLVYYVNEPSPGEEANCFSLTLMYFDHSIPLQPPYVQVWTCKDVMKDDELLLSYGEEYPRDYAINMQSAKNNCYTFCRMDKKDFRILDMDHPLGVVVSTKPNPFQDNGTLSYHVYDTLQALIAKQ